MLWGFPRRMTVDAVTDCVLGKLASATCACSKAEDIRNVEYYLKFVSYATLRSHDRSSWKSSILLFIQFWQNFIVLCPDKFDHDRSYSGRYFNITTRSAMDARSLREKYLRKVLWIYNFVKEGGCAHFFGQQFICDKWQGFQCLVSDPTACINCGMIHDVGATTEMNQTTKETGSAEFEHFKSLPIEWTWRAW